MKTIVIAIFALLPLLSFSQSVDIRTSNKAPEGTAVKQQQQVRVAQTQEVKSEEQLHAEWLQNNAHYKTMSNADRTKTIQELETKLSFNLNSPEAIHLQREIKWIKELEEKN